MTRLFLGWENGVGGVIKIMANDTDNPLTTPDADWWKFRFNSKTAEIGYGDLAYNLTINMQGLTYVGFPGQEFYYPEGSNSSNYKVWVHTVGSGSYRAVTHFSTSALWVNRNIFPFAFESTTDFRYKYTMFQRNYAGSSDSRTISLAGYPKDRLIPYSSSGVFTIRGLDALDSNILYTPGRLDQHDGTLLSHMPAAYNFACYYLDMPVNNAAYPSVAPGAPVSGQKMFHSSPAGARMSKPGFNVDTATTAQCIFNSDKLPMKIIKTDIITVNAGAAPVNVPMGRTLAQSTFVDYQVSTIGGTLWIPPWPDVDSKAICQVAYRFNGTNLQFQNTGAVNVQVRYVVMAQDDLAPSVGTAKVLDANFSTGTIVLRRPTSAGTRFADTILDSDLAYMPMVAQNWVPIGNFAASDLTQVGGLMHRVTLTNPSGSWKPYVLAKLACQKKSDATQVFYMDPYAKKLDNTHDFAASNFMIRVTDTLVTFYASTNNARDEDAYRVGAGAWTTIKWDWIPIGLRYYIFAIPNSL